VADNLLGIHHVTSIASDPQRNIDFYTRLLGLRLVKRTVNFDDPTTYHLYYGDEIGHPGTILTFFPWQNAPQGRLGSGQVSVTSFAIPRDSTEFWTERLLKAKIEVSKPIDRFDENVISFSDPDGLQLELVAASNTDPDLTWKDSNIPIQHGIRGFFNITLIEQSTSKTENLLIKMGFCEMARDGSRTRFSTGDGNPGTILDVLHAPDSESGQVAVGSVHHVAWRTPNEGEQKEWRSKLVDARIQVTPVIDRTYFHSIYFREPGGVLFEIATDPPGFTVDESSSQLGTSLMLPRWLEPIRPNIERNLAPVRLPYN
jgi:glyoxalase family protein